MPPNSHIHGWASCASSSLQTRQGWQDRCAAHSQCTHSGPPQRPNPGTTSNSPTWGGNVTLERGIAGFLDVETLHFECWEEPTEITPDGMLLFLHSVICPDFPDSTKPACSSQKREHSPQRWPHLQNSPCNSWCPWLWQKCHSPLTTAIVSTLQWVCTSHLMLLQGLELASSTPAGAHHCEPLSSSVSTWAIQVSKEHSEPSGKALCSTKAVE